MLGRNARMVYCGCAVTRSKLITRYSRFYCDKWFSLSSASSSTSTSSLHRHTIVNNNGSERGKRFSICGTLPGSLGHQSLCDGTLLRLLCLRNIYRKYSSSTPIMNVFDRQAKRIQRNVTSTLKDYEVYDYLKEEVGWRTADRISDVKRKFDVALDLGCGRGHMSKNIYSDMVGTLYMSDMAEKVLAQAQVSPEVPSFKIHADEEFLPFKSESLDLVVSSLSLHWVNDLPGVLKQIHNALKRDGCLIGAMFGGDTLFELRVALQLAETEKEGGLAAHVSPFTSAQDLGGLLNRTGYGMLTIDIDDIVIRYPSMLEVMKDIKGMGESNCAWSRRPMIPRDTLKMATEIYQERFGSDAEEGVPATYQVINFIGWKPDPSQREAAARGSGQVSLKDLDKIDRLAKEMENLKTATSGDERLNHSVRQLADDIEKLRRATGEDPDGNPEDNDRK